jgi:PAS domain S-box-containing protein
VLAVTSDISGRKRAEKLQLDENHVLTLMGQGVELSELLDAIVRLGESHDPAVKGSVMLYDSSKELLFQAAGPSLPDSYLKLLENGVAIGPNMGSCGTAAHLRERVVIPDISNTPLFPVKEVTDQIISNGLLACWSQPIIASNGELLGTIANYSTKKGEPNPADIRVLEWSASIAAIAIERKRAEEALSNEAIRRRILIEQSREGIVVLDQNGNVYESNQRFAEMLGYSLEEVYKLQVWDWEFQFTPEQVLNMIQSVDETGDHFETRHKRKDGTIYDVEISTNGAVFAGEKLIFCVCRDITERKRAEEALRLSDAAFRSIHESVIVTDLDGIVTHWNEISEQMFGIKATDAIGKRFLEVIEVVENYPGETPDRIKNIQTQGYWQEERLYRTPKGDIWVDVHLQDIVDNDKRYGRVMLATDITQRKQAEVELKQALAKLEESSARLAATNQELEAFSYSVSHDLRSPLRSIDGFSQALLEDYNDKLDDNGQDFLKRLRGASQKMGELIDGLLKLSRLTRSEMHEETVDMSALAEEIAARLQETPEGRRAKFTIDKSLSARGDPQLLRVLLENLLNNAWKFTRQKPLAKIEFGAVQNNGKKTYFVKDNGAGFDIAYSDKLFSAFQRLHDSTDFPGTGIGLATVKRIINRHGGTIRAEGEVGKGATFYFTLD